MKALHCTIVVSFTVVLVAGLVLNFGGCSRESPLQSPEMCSATSFKGKPGDYDAPYPQSGSYTYRFWPSHNAYRGGDFSIPNGSDFSISWGELIPPPETPWGENVPITMTCERDTVRNELIFTFGPDGCQFNPSAKVFLDWSDLGIDQAMLYYIDEDGNYIEQNPDYTDYQGKRMLLYIDHFSRYAVAFAN